MAPLIGITSGEIVNHEHPWSPVVYGQSHFYIDAVINAGGVPVILPMTHHTKILHDLYTRLDGILFAGGNDINPRYYHEERSPKVEHLSELRDTVELRLLHWMLQDHKPLLAICRGMQLVNVGLGGTLHQHIPDDIPGALNHTDSTDIKNVAHKAHKLHINDDSKLAQILKSDNIYANTHHHQAVKELGAGLQAVAYASDGVIEAIESPAYPNFIGVQCHPESLEVEAEPKWRHLFDWFVQEAKKSTA